MCTGPKWKREVVPDHKFDFVDTREFTDNGFMMRLKYLWLYLIVLKSFLVYVSDIFTAITMLTTHTWSNQIFNDCTRIDGCIPIPFDVGKWLFVGCIIFSFALLGYESRKAKKIIASRDISYAFTNVMANNYYSLRSYDHFCFFDHISNSTKTSDDFAFFVFFVFKSWKRVLLADGPRQTINALTLYAIFLAKESKPGDWYDVRKYFDGNTLSTSVLTVTTFFTVVVFIGSLLLLIVAGVCYVPLLCYIRGNLKEYCCHKVDKRISSVIKRRQKQRLADAAKLAQKEAQGDFSHLKNKKGEFIAQPLPQPTLPNVKLDDDDDASSMHTRVPPPSTYTYNTQDQYYYNSDKGDYPPPMPAYNPYSHHQSPGAPPINPSYDDSLYNYPQSGTPAPYEDQYSQQYAGHMIERPGTANSSGYFNSHPGYAISRPGTVEPVGGYQNHGMERPGNEAHAMRYGEANYDPHDVYQGRTLTSPDPATRRSPLSSSRGPTSPSEGLAYDMPPSAHGGSYAGQDSPYEASSATSLASPYNGYSGYSSYNSQQGQPRYGGYS